MPEMQTPFEEPRGRPNSHAPESNPRDAHGDASRVVRHAARSDDEDDLVLQAELVDVPPAAPARKSLATRNEMYRPHLPRRKKIPLILFALTCLSTFWVGATCWQPEIYLLDMFISWNWMPARRTLLRHWDTGLIYMVCVLAILLVHEMGHFIATLIHKVRASLPYFLPIPFNAIGTLGAVIGMDGRSADRRQIFDIGIAGPIAGVIVAVPIMWVGVGQLDLQTNEPGGRWCFDSPLAVSWMLDIQRPPGYQPGQRIWISQLNPFYMAGWIGLLITGLNMLPVSQLDGGHITYTLFGKRAHWIARAFLVMAIAYVVYAQAQIWILMIILVLVIGTDHPPTKNDEIPLGWCRTILGYSSLLIPILCFPPKGLVFFTDVVR